MQLLSLVCGFEVLLLTLVQLSTFFSSLLGESFFVCVLSQQSQCSLAGSMPTLRGIVRLCFKTSLRVNKATLLSGAAVALT